MSVFSFALLIAVGAMSTAKILAFGLFFFNRAVNAPSRSQYQKFFLLSSKFGTY